MVLEGAWRGCDTEQLRTQSGGLPGVLRHGRRPEPARQSAWVPTHVHTPHAHAHTHMHTCEQVRGTLPSADAALLLYNFHPHTMLRPVLSRGLDFFHVVLCANEIKSAPIGTGLMEMINFY